MGFSKLICTLIRIRHGMRIRTCPAQHRAVTDLLFARLAGHQMVLLPRDPEYDDRAMAKRRRNGL
jgi:hypothetical protein